jgi:hypothetical protein
MLKVDPHPDYPLEDGRYLRGNDFSSVAVAIIPNTDEDKIPAELESLVRVGIETGAAMLISTRFLGRGYRGMFIGCQGERGRYILTVVSP